jgi:hypothetical protein
MAEGIYLAVGTQQGMVYVWDAHQGKKVRTIHAHHRRVSK